ncbi:hypothetical protein PMAYCL1PPCAC_09635, partial [Pristionchus mayeri]
LTSIKKELVPNGAFVYQLNDGTMFYREWTTPVRLYVNIQGKEIDAILPSRKISYEGVDGDAIYFMTDREQFCEAVFNTKKGIEIYYLRDKLKEELVHSRAICSRVIEGKLFVYRMSDVIFNRGIPVDIPEKELKNAQLLGIHRGLVVYAKSKPGLVDPEVSAWSSTVLMIEVPNMLMSCMNILQIKFYAQDCSPFIYFSVDGRVVYTFDAETMELLPPFSIEDTRLESIASVRDDEITVKAKSDAYYLISAKLPKRYAYV